MQSAHRSPSSRLRGGHGPNQRTWMRSGRPWRPARAHGDASWPEPLLADGRGRQAGGCGSARCRSPDVDHQYHPHCGGRCEWPPVRAVRAAEIADGSRTSTCYASGKPDTVSCLRHWRGVSTARGTDPHAALQTRRAGDCCPAGKSIAGGCQQAAGERQPEATDSSN
jgi:hypothetical protein